MKKREIKDWSYSVIPVEVDAGFTESPADWLTEKAKENKLTTLLAHADDGVIWGRMDGQRLTLSGDAFPKVSPPLRVVTLQQARLFGEQAELLVWQDGDGNWHARLLDDEGTEQQGWCFDEPQLQWGDHAEAEKDGFTLVAEGQEGLRHAVPLLAIAIPFDPPERRRDLWHPVCLGVRHYLEPDEDGMLIIIQSRLTKLWAKKREEGSDE